MKVLFLNPEQYVDFENEPSNYQVRLPALNSGVIAEHQDFVYQRELKKSGRQAMHEKAMEIFDTFKPDIVVNSLCWWQECIDWRTLADMRRAGGKVISIYWDTWINALPHETELFLNSDLILVMDSLSNYFKYRLLAEQHGHFNKVVFSPIAVHTDTVHAKKIKQDIDVLMLGSHEGQRANLFNYLESELASRGIVLKRLGGLVDDTSEDKNSAENWINWDEYTDTINRAKICISSQTQPDRHQIKGKIFDFLSCGSFCLTDDNPELHAFVPDDCMGYYTDQEDCLNKIIWFLENETDRLKIAGNGHQWFNDVYNYKKFWQNTLTVALAQEQQLLQLPGIEEAFQNFKNNQDIVIRLQAAVLNQLAQLAATGQTIKRLPVRAEGSYNGLNILSVDERFTVVSDNLDIDFVEVGNEILAITPESGIIKLVDQDVSMSRQTRIVKLANIQQAKQAIDIMNG